MDKTKAVMLAAVAALAGTVILVETRDEKGETKEVTKRVAEAAVLTADAQDAKTEAEVATKQKLEHAVYSRTVVDGGQVYFARKETLDAGVSWVKLQSSPCRARPVKADPSSCMRKDPRDAKELLDPGDENVMQPGEAVGDGCVEVPCAVILGE